MESNKQKSNKQKSESESLADVVLRTWNTFLQQRATSAAFASNANVTRNVTRRVLYVIGTMRALVVVLMLASCGDNSAAPSPDAHPEELRTCESLGCPITSISLLCVQHGGEYCTCDPDARGPLPAQVCTYPGSTP
jgi:hypothetical protein